MCPNLLLKNYSWDQEESIGVLALHVSKHCLISHTAWILWEQPRKLNAGSSPKAVLGQAPPPFNIKCIGSTNRCHHPSI